jgi:hypothetical protein
MAHRPLLGGDANSSFPLQFGDAKISDISLSVTLIEQLSNDGQDSLVAHGSGFFWRAGTRVYLVTARHVLSGRSPFDDNLLSSHGYIPKRICIYPAVEIFPDQWRRVRVVVDLAKEGGWIEDPDFEKLRTDIAALPLVAEGAENTRCLNDGPLNFEPILTHVGMDCAIVGYPTANFGGLMTPIWRRGTIASEPLLPIDNKPMFLLDAATSPGFSGSPVFRRHYGPAPVQQPDGSVTVLVDRILTTSFVGVYAGRLQHPYVGGEVPFVFYGNRLPKIIP